MIGPVINDPNKASNALKVIVRIMDERYNMFAAAGVRNIEVYNNMVEQQGGRPKSRWLSSTEEDSIHPL